MPLLTIFNNAIWGSVLCVLFRKCHMARIKLIMHAPGIAMQHARKYDNTAVQQKGTLTTPLVLAPVPRGSEENLLFSLMGRWVFSLSVAVSFCCGE